MFKVNRVIIITRPARYGGQAVTTCSINEQLTHTW